jgi:hypothetical protein
MINGIFEEDPHEDIGHIDKGGLASLESIKMEPE